MQSVLGVGEDRLSIYLNDHLAGSTAGADLARRLEREHGSALVGLADDIEQDRRTLIELMERLGVDQDRAKAALAWAAEKASRLKLQGELLGSSPLNRLEKLEALALGVEGKRALWQALRHTHAGDARLGGIDFDELIERAGSQRGRLERERIEAAGAALN